MPLQQAYGHAGRVFGLAFHPIWGPNILASASEDESVRVWCRTGPTDDWEQTGCCRGHQAEVLRVAWSPDGRILASGSADHTVRLWQVGTQGQSSYSGAELAVLKDHPGEVYGLKFLNLPTIVTQQVPPPPAAAAAVGQQQQQQHDTTQDTPKQVAAADQSIQQQQQQQQFVQYDTLLTASGEALFLWDLTSGRIIHQSAPLPVMSMLRKLQLSSSSSIGRPQGSGILNPAGAGVGFAAGALDPKPQQQQQQQQRQQQEEEEDLGSDPTAAAGDEAEEEEEEEEVPSYIFGVAAADATNWLAAVCSDGMMRLWDASKRSLQEIAAVKVHPSDMGSAVSFVPQQPWLILALSKKGQTVLQDIRMMGRPLLQQQLEGPVYDMAWTVTDVLDQGLNGVDAAAAAAGVSSVSELMLNVVGCDEYIRRYPFNRAALQAGQLPDPELVSVSSDYTGRLMTLAATLDGKTLAAAGDAVQADQIKPRKPRTTTNHQIQQQQRQQGHSDVGRRAANGSIGVGEHRTGGQSTAAAAAAKRAAAAAGRHSRRRRVAVDLFDMEDEDQKDLASRQQQQQQQPPTQSSNPSAKTQREAQPAAAAAAAQGSNGGNEVTTALSTTVVDGVDYSEAVEAFAESMGAKVSDMPPEWAQMVAAAVAAGMLGGGEGKGGGGGGGAGCAQASGVLTRAPLFTMQTGRLYEQS